MRLFSGNPRRQFEQQAHAYLQPLYHAALRLARQVEWAEDLTQDTLIRAYERYPQFTPGTNFRSWLFTILTHVYLNDCERARRRPVTASFETANAHGEIWEVADEDADSDPLHALLTHVLDERLQGALDALPEEFRVAIILVDLEDLSYQHTAEALHVPIGTVRSRVFRGRALLRAALEPAPPQADSHTAATINLPAGSAKKRCKETSGRVEGDMASNQAS